MKKLTKENKGITLVALIITIVLMLILTSVTTYTGFETFRNMQVTKFVTQMQLIQGKVDELKESKAIEELLVMGEPVPSNKETIITTASSKGEITGNDTRLYRYFSSEDLKQELHLEDGIDGDIMINFATREIVSTIGIEYEDEKYYTQYLLPNGQKLIDNTSQTNRELSFDLNVSVDGLNATIIISNIQITNGTLRYREQEDSYWNIITNYTETDKEETILVSKSATYEFKLTDNTTAEEGTVVTKNLVLTNKPKTETQIDSYNYSLTSQNWAYATDANGNNYVWIPRFAYKIDENNQNIIEFLKGNSSIATDNSTIDETWIVSDKFNSEDSTKLTGIWVKVTNKNQSGIDMIDLLNSATTTLATI